MKRYTIAILILFLAVTFNHAQGLSDIQGQNAGNSVTQLDSAVRLLAVRVNQRLATEKAEKVSVGQFPFRGNSVPLGSYWINQLTGELANFSNKSYVVLSSGAAGADWTISGEIIEAVGTVRLFTQLIRTGDRAVIASYNFDLERNDQINAMLASAGGQGGRSTAPVAPDSLEPDSFESPVPYEIGSDENAQLVNRTLHSGDEDFFLLILENDGQLTMETTGSTDTFMELFLEETRERLAHNDDGGSDLNARIRYNAKAGTRYIVKVKGFESSDVGAYGFRAWISGQLSAAAFENAIPYTIGADESAPYVNRVLLSRGREDYFLLVPENDGLLVMETNGNVDTYMEFFDAETRRILAEDDDSGREENARIRFNVKAGTRYIAKVRGYQGDSGEYGFHAYIQVQIRFEPDEFEPDNDAASAKLIEVGTSQRHTFHSSNDVDWVKFQITRPGHYTIRAKGSNSNRLDTYIEVYDSNMNPIGEDDDGGENLDSRLTLYLESGLYYLKAECIEENPGQPYDLSVMED